MAYNDRIKESNAKSNKKNCKTYLLKLTKSTDADIIAFLDGLDNKQGYIKELIRKELNANNC